LWVGRKDAHTKIRGHGIDTKEIELALLSQESVSAAVVTVSETLEGNPRIIAYVIPSGHPAPSATKLRRALATILPHYMIPSTFITLDKFPMAPNGKVNRCALPLPPSVQPQLDTPFVPPQSTVEQTLARIWMEVLSLDRVGVDDDFFDLGGDSLAAIRVAYDIYKTFQVKIPHNSLFQSPTIKAMESIIAKHQKNTLDTPHQQRIFTTLRSLSQKQSAMHKPSRGRLFSTENQQK
jgi:acyl carrier protein